MYKQYNHRKNRRELRGQLAKDARESHERVGETLYRSALGVIAVGFIVNFSFGWVGGEGYLSVFPSALHGWFGIVGIVVLTITVRKGRLVKKQRDTGEKFSLSLDAASVKIPELLDVIQSSLFNQALEFRAKNTHSVSTWDEFKTIVEKGGFIKCGWDGTAETENKIKAETKATIRCIPFDGDPSELKCIFTGNTAKHQVIFSKAY